ncbi:MAG: 50S ribosomal protein L9 [SAR116 cluster bacterium MED-G04]|jgi:large subunit ribosomal protein L9|nr:50S ribosomal protein L9 [SAR116 cluster bacterium]OUW37422.1 MAG: 50S ribosomal protein L9 [Gammaproteobacteria bacterium TMED183]PDH65639.1 MAG: 50S ribosomal protein L9 [SAR116 cluster bacterium MED-G04]HCD49370.1 50S ribosomal protein L9 [Alphaproteobacteria bacterium]HCV61685.1 50S ribosomal protein L9 [Alphaproteobacteria bacterium]|tara:strand:+ start:8339 stop:9061 length:723 start_codon:yes stop_codon:yes gene_type:complete
MEVILLERIEKLGQMGDLVTVKPGYARNFLLPQGKALRATEANKKRFETDRAQLEAENLARKGEAEQVAAKMEGMSVTLIRAASEMGQLYGSASSRDIADRIIDAGVTITRNQVDLNTAIKTLGLFPIRIVLHPEVSVDVTVNIARSEDEAAEQRRLGRAIISDIAERERAEAAEAAREAADRMAAMEDEDDEETTGSSASAESTDEAADAPAEADADASDETADKAAEENGEETEETKE